MSWHFLQAGEVACWPEKSLAGAPSALLSLIPEQGKLCSTVNETESLSHSQYGMTSEPSTEGHGAAMSMLSQPDFHARTSASAGGGAGLDGDRSGLWVEARRVIRDVMPRLVVVENSPMLTSRGLGRVLADLAGMGMDARWGVFRASSVGAAHHRARLFMVAYPNGAKLEGLDFPQPIRIDTKESRRRQFARAIDATLPADDYASMSRNPDDVARGMDGLKATGNGWVPAMAARAIVSLAGTL
jgi:hypothetical protein